MRATGSYQNLYVSRDPWWTPVQFFLSQVWCQGYVLPAHSLSFQEQGALEKQLCVWEGIVLSQSNRTFLICLKSVLLTLGAVGGRFALGTSVQVRRVGVLCNSQC